MFGTDHARNVIEICFYSERYLEQNEKIVMKKVKFYVVSKKNWAASFAQPIPLPEVIYGAAIVVLRRRFGSVP